MYQYVSSATSRPFNVEPCDPWLLTQHIPYQLVPQWRLRRNFQCPQLFVFIFGMHVVSNSDKFLVAIGSCKQDNSDANQVVWLYSRGSWRSCLSTV